MPVCKCFQPFEPARRIFFLFQLCEKTYLMANGVTIETPYYQLTKSETLYITTNSS